VDILTKVLFVFLSFFLGSLFTVMYARWQKIKKNRDFRIFYINWYQMSMGALRKQIEHISSYVGELEKSNEFNSTFKMNNVQLDVLTSIPKAEIFEAFVFKFKGDTKTNSKKTYLMISHVNHIIHVLTQIQEKFFEDKKAYQVWLDDWNKKVVNFNKTKYDYLINCEERRYVSFAEEISNLDNGKHKNKENINSQDFIKYYVTPLEPILVRHLQRDLGNNRAIGLLEAFQSLQIQRKHLDYHVSSTASLYKTYQNSLETTVKENSENISYFDNFQRNLKNLNLIFKISKQNIR
jgi:hypothetical protein